MYIDSVDSFDRACFNGAAARTQRRPGPSMIGIVRVVGFNGAAARTQRRPGVIDAASFQEAASMGPLRERSGDPGNSVLQVSLFTSFNGAAARTQRRPGHMVQAVRSVRHRFNGAAARTQRRPTSRGPAGCAALRASMGPLRERSGDQGSIGASMSYIEMLQW